MAQHVNAAPDQHLPFNPSSGVEPIVNNTKLIVTHAHSRLQISCVNHV